MQNESRDMGKKGRSIRILLVDDSRDILETVARYLTIDKRLVIVGKAMSAPEAMAIAESASPDLIIMDMSMPEMNGIEATRLFKEQADAPAVILLTLFDYPEYHHAAERVGADAVLSKTDMDERLLPLIGKILPRLEYIGS